MAKCGECLHSENECVCKPIKTNSLIFKDPNGERYFNGEVAAGIALLTLLAIPILLFLFNLLIHK